jgi:hypothetical protein
VVTVTGTIILLEPSIPISDTRIKLPVPDPVLFPVTLTSTYLLLPTAMVVDPVVPQLLVSMLKVKYESPIVSILLIVNVSVPVLVMIMRLLELVVVLYTEKSRELELKLTLAAGVGYTCSHTPLFLTQAAAGSTQAPLFLMNSFFKGFHSWSLIRITCPVAIDAYI